MMKAQKGITLVALIITIIVMLILVGVSVTVAINGGLFDNARQAGADYEAKAEEESAGKLLNVNNKIVDINEAINALK